MSKYIVDWDAELGPGNCLTWTKVTEPEDFAEEKSLTEEIDQKVLKAMKTLASRLSLAIEFNYMTISWSEGLKSPLIQLWYHKPAWETGIDDYGEDYAGWKGKNDWSGWGVLDSRMIKQDLVLSSLSQDTDFSKFMIKRTYKNG